MGRDNVPRRIFRPKKDEVTGGWRKLINEEFHNLYSSLSVIRMIKSRRMRWRGHAARIRKTRKRKMGGEARGKEATKRLRCTWVDNLKTYLRQTATVV
jgi:hypothetical protein